MKKENQMHTTHGSFGIRRRALGGVRSRVLLLAVVATGTAAIPSAPAVVLWTGGGADTNWSTTANWDPAGSPAGGDLLFENFGTNNGTKVSNRVDANTTVGSLSYTNSTGSGAYHVTQIDAGTTLTVDGSTTSPNALFVGMLAKLNKTTYTRVKMVGGGNFVINAPQSQALVTKVSDNEHGEAHLNMSGLSACNMSVSNFAIGRYDRGTGFVTLPTNGVGTTTITAARVGIGDSVGNANGEISELILGCTNTLHADSIGIGGPSPGSWNQTGGTVYYPTGLVNPTLTIRGSSGGSSRADLTLGSHGALGSSTDRSIAGDLRLTNGTVNAMVGTLIIGEGRGKTTNKGRATGTLSMASGIVDASSVVLGRTLSGSSGSAVLTTGTLNVSGGRFVAGPLSMAVNNSGADQAVVGNLNISGTGIVAVAGDVTLGTKNGTATNAVATVNLAGGSLTVLGNMASGANPTGVTSVVTLRGGALAVTNAVGDATLRIERGTFAIKAGTATLNRLVTTNALATTQVELRGTGSSDYGHVTASGDVLLGGSLTVSLNGYTIDGGEVWTIVGGTGTRTGTFATTDIPAEMRVFYTANGYQLVCPAPATILMVR